ncbi:uncharacterized protein VTP21DRAFT_10601 [Calcarisporiella thermophila]|uniref:uncharacterized protein n=1 Tax=Calcarisporiella thermophila TaxID=911321 RepID=UPI003744799A
MPCCLGHGGEANVQLMNWFGSQFTMLTPEDIDVLWDRLGKEVPLGWLVARLQKNGARECVVAGHRWIAKQLVWALVDAIIESDIKTCTYPCTPGECIHAYIMVDRLGCLLPYTAVDAILSTAIGASGTPFLCRIRFGRIFQLFHALEQIAIRTNSLIPLELHHSRTPEGGVQLRIRACGCTVHWRVKRESFQFELQAGGFIVKGSNVLLSPKSMITSPDGTIANPDVISANLRSQLNFSEKMMLAIGAGALVKWPMSRQDAAHRVQEFTISESLPLSNDIAPWLHALEKPWCRSNQYQQPCLTIMLSIAICEQDLDFAGELQQMGGRVVLAVLNEADATAKATKAEISTQKQGILSCHPLLLDSQWSQKLIIGSQTETPKTFLVAMNDI